MPRAGGCGRRMFAEHQRLALRWDCIVLQWLRAGEPDLRHLRRVKLVRERGDLQVPAGSLLSCRFGRSDTLPVDDCRSGPKCYGLYVQHGTMEPSSRVLGERAPPAFPPHFSRACASHPSTCPRSATPVPHVPLTLKEMRITPSLATARLCVYREA